MPKKAETTEECKAQIQSLSVLGEIHGKIGGHTVYRLKGKQIIRKNGKPSVPPSPAQILQRKKFAFLQKKGKEFYSIISQTLPMKNGKTTINQFISLNIRNVVVTEEGCTFLDKPIFAELHKIDFVDARHALHLRYRYRTGFFALPTYQNRIYFYNPTTQDFSIHLNAKIHSPPNYIGRVSLFGFPDYNHWDSWARQEETIVQSFL